MQWKIIQFLSVHLWFRNKEVQSPKPEEFRSYTDSCTISSSYVFSINCQNSFNKNIQLDRGMSLTGMSSNLFYCKSFDWGAFLSPRKLRLPSLALVCDCRWQKFPVTCERVRKRSSLAFHTISFLLNLLLDYARILMATFDWKMRRDANHIQFFK